jgi:hypothetical protein
MIIFLLSLLIGQKASEWICGKSKPTESDNEINADLDEYKIIKPEYDKDYTRKPQKKWGIKFDNDFIDVVDGKNKERGE